MSSKSTFSNSTSRSYALALYELAKESSILNKAEEEIRFLRQLLNENSDFKEIISNPMISKENKQKIIFEIFDKSDFSKITKNFLFFVASKNRLFFLNKIVESFLNLVSKTKGELNAELISSKELTTEDQKKIETELSTGLKSPLKINYKYDPQLIGGLIIQIGSMMIDTSIKTQLKKLEKNMIEA